MGFWETQETCSLWSNKRNRKRKRKEVRRKQERIKQISKKKRGATGLIRFLDGPGIFVHPQDIAVYLNKDLPALQCEHNFPSIPFPGFILSFFFLCHCSSIAMSSKWGLLLSRGTTESCRPPRWTGDAVVHNQLCQAGFGLWLVFPQICCSSWQLSQSLPHMCLWTNAGLCLAQPVC